MKYAARHSIPGVIDESLIPVPEEEQIYTDPIPEDEMRHIEYDYMRTIMIPNPIICEELLALCGAAPVDIDLVHSYLEQHYPDKATLTKVLLEYIWRHAEECGDSFYDLAELFCEYGIEPNAFYDGMNVMHMLNLIDHEYVAADVLKLFFENGGDPGLTDHEDSVFLDVDFDVCFWAVEEEARERYDSLVHYWMVWVGYGAKLPDGRDPITLRSGCTIEMFKNHRNLDFCLEAKGKDYTMHIFDRKTKWEIATDDPCPDQNQTHAGHLDGRCGQ